MAGSATIDVPPRPRSPQELAKIGAPPDPDLDAEEAEDAEDAEHTQQAEGGDGGPSAPEAAEAPTTDSGSDAPPDVAEVTEVEPAEEEPTRGARWRDLALPVAVAITPVVAACVVQLLHMHDTTFPGGDWALLTRDTQKALSGHLLLGPYSRFGWRHPGPMLAYWFAPFYAVSGHHFDGIALGAASLNLVAIATMVLAAGRAAGRRTAWATTAVLLGYSFSLGLGRLAEPWSPAAVVLPLATTAVLAAAVAAGRRWMLPLLAIVASFCAQTHLGSAPVLVAFIAPLVLIGAWRERRRLLRWALPMLAALAVTTACWIPTMVEQHRARPGNITEIQKFLDKQPDTVHAWSEMEPSLEQLLPVTVPRFSTYLGGMAPPPNGARDIDFIALGILAGGLLGGLVTGWVRRDKYLLGLAVVGITAVPANIYALQNVAGLIYPYLAFYAVSTGIVAWLVTVDTFAGMGAAVALVFRERHHHRFRHSRPPMRPFSARLFAVALIVVAAVLAVNAGQIHTQGQVRTSPVVASFSTEARQVLRLMGNPKHVEVDMAQDQWPVAAGMVLNLEQHGYHVTVRQAWGYLFGPWSSTDGKEQIRLVLAPTGSNIWPAHRADQPVSSHDGDTLFVGSP